MSLVGHPVIANTDGNVGTNGNLAGVGDPTTINGTLSTPRSGVGDCTTDNVTAATISGWATVKKGLVTLPQPITLPTPPLPSTHTSNVTFNAGGCPAGTLYCAPSAGGSTITPPSPNSVVSLGNVTLNGNAVVHLKAGIYEVNSLKLAGNATIVVDSGSGDHQRRRERRADPTRPGWWRRLESPPSIRRSCSSSMAGPARSRSPVGPYGGAGLRAQCQRIAGRQQHAFLRGDGTNKITSTGGFNLHYDCRLKSSTMTAGNPTMNTFSWTLSDGPGSTSRHTRFGRPYDLDSLG